MELWCEAASASGGGGLRFFFGCGATAGVEVETLFRGRPAARFIGGGLGAVLLSCVFWVFPRARPRCDAEFGLGKACATSSIPGDASSRGVSEDCRCRVPRLAVELACVLSISAAALRSSLPLEVACVPSTSSVSSSKGASDEVSGWSGCCRRVFVLLVPGGARGSVCLSISCLSVARNGRLTPSVLLLERVDVTIAAGPAVS